ncbi:MAG: O-antigen ligase family protein [Chloroflexota bacterium]|nr:O-antigen ligase family protein [Chloroflexota bacterium]
MPSQRWRSLSKIKWPLIGVVVIGLGILLGYLICSPEMNGLTISILVISAVLLIIVNNPLDGILIWLIFASFIEIWINIPMGAGIPDLTFSRFIIVFVAIFMLARAATGKFQFARIGLTEVCIVAATIGIMMSAPLSVNPRGTIQTSITLRFAPLAMYFFTKNLVRNKEDLHRLLLAGVIFGSAAALYAIYEHTTGNILFLPENVSASDLWVEYSEHLRILRGLLGRSSNFARVLTSSIPITFYLFFEKRSIARKITLVGMLAIQAYGLFLTYNRTSWYALLISLFIIQFFYPRFRKVFFFIVFAVAIVLWATWEQIDESAVVNERVRSEVSTLEGREVRWEAGYNMWRAKPIRGWGFDQYQRESWRFRTDGGQGNIYAIENDYLHLLVASGLIGFLPYLLFILTPLVNSLRLSFKARRPDWSGFIKPETLTIYWGTILSFIIGSFTQIQTQPIVLMLPFALAGAVVGTHEHWLRGPKAKKGLSRPESTQDG